MLAEQNHLSFCSLSFCPRVSLHQGDVPCSLLHYTLIFGSFFIQEKQNKGKKKKEWLSNFWYSHSMKSNTAIKKLKGLPFGSVVRNVSCLCGRHRFDPWSGQILHTTEQLSLSAPTTDTRVPQSLCSAAREASATRSLHTTTGEWPLLAVTREKPMQPRRLNATNTYINKIIFLKRKKLFIH